MPRDVKFRVWDKNNERMEEIDGIDLYLADNKIYEVGDRSYAYSNYMDKKDVTEQYELMQYTGLKDKNGTEIYEGDIIKSIYTENCLEDALESIYCCKWDNDNAAFIFEGEGIYVDQDNVQEIVGVNKYESEFNLQKEWKSTHCNSWYKIESFVVGNIYETPDLLQGG